MAKNLDIDIGSGLSVDIGPCCDPACVPAPLVQLVHPLLTTKHTVICHEGALDMQYGAPHRFKVIPATGGAGPIQRVLTEVHFQEGPIGECGVNGVHHEDLISMVIARLEFFQKSAYACRENEKALEKLEEALMWMRRRTLDRNKRGVEGTSGI